MPLRNLLRRVKCQQRSLQQGLQCDFCGQDFQETDLWIGQWQDILLHMSCLEQWRADPPRPYSRRKGSRPLPLIDAAGPPEVRVVRLALSSRPQEPRVPPDLPKAPPPQPRPRPRHVSPIRTRPRRHKKKKTHRKSQTDLESDNDNKLPMSVTLGRALGAQVQPLMAILMSPRVRTCSLDSENSNDEERSDEEEKLTSKAKTPLLTITSLELPDLAPRRKAHCVPVRRVRTSIRRTRQPALCATPEEQNIACAGLALTTRK